MLPFLCEEKTCIEKCVYVSALKLYLTLFSFFFFYVTPAAEATMEPH